MNKTKIKKITIISIIVVVIISVGGFGLYKYNKFQTYNSLVSSANRYMDSGDYDKAVALFNQALDYKNDNNIRRNIKLAENLKDVKKFYDNGIKDMSDKKYIDAIGEFDKVTKEDDKLYNNAKKKIAECKKQLIADVNDLVKNSKYDDANKELDEILKIDADNSEAKKLKDTVAKAVKDQQDKAAYAKQQEEKAKADEAVKQAASSGNVPNADAAFNIIKNKFNYTALGICYDYTGDAQHDGKDFYIIHVFENHPDHIATLGWYDVEKKSGRIYDEMTNSYVN